MIHPLKAATTFDCDGCGHHASFHKMDNATDDEAVRRWEQVKMAADGSRTALIRPRSPDVQEIVPKRRRITNISKAGQRYELRPVDGGSGSIAHSDS